MRNHITKISSAAICLASASILGGFHDQAKAADFKLTEPTGEFKFTVSSTLQRFDPDGDSASADKNFNTAVGDSTISDDLLWFDLTPAFNAVPPQVVGPTGGDGAFVYSNFDAGQGFFDEFESNGPQGNPFPAQGGILDIVAPFFIPPGGEIALNVPKFLAMDAQTSPPLQPNAATALPPGNELNYYNLLTVKPLFVTQEGDATTATFSTTGTYSAEVNGVEVSSHSGTLSFTRVFDGLGEQDVIDLFWESDTEPLDGSWDVQGRVQKAPEPSSVLGLGILFGTAFLAKRKKS